MNFFYIMYILFLISSIIAVGSIMLLHFSIGIPTAWKYAKVKLKKRKGWGLVKIIHQTGYPELIPYKFDGKQFITPFKDDTEIYTFKHHCLQDNEFRIPTITYRAGDSDPINPKTGLQTVTNSKGVGNLMKNYLNAESGGDHALAELLKKHGFKIVIAVGAIIAVLAFLNLRQFDTISEITRTCGQQVIMNASQLGK